MMRIGNQTSFASSSVLEPFEFAVARGFDAFEFFPDRGFSGRGGWHENDLSSATREEIRRTASARHLELTVHAPLEFNPLLQPHSARLHSTVEFATDIGATLLNLHLEAGRGVNRFVEALEPTLRLTAGAGLKLAVENTVWTGPDDFNAFFASLRAGTNATSAHVGMCFDLGHANLYGATRNNFWKYFDALAPDTPVIHLHLHENFGDADRHLTLFTGPSRDDTAGLAGLLDRLRKRNFKGCAILEQWPQPDSLLVNARNGLLALLEKDLS